jgi:predicted nucleic acid-binding protein
MSAEIRGIFVDTFYWIARINPRDQWHHKSLALNSSLKDAHLITSEAVLIELLNYFSNYGPEMRKAVALIVRAIIHDLNATIISGDFEKGLLLFGSRLDKGYSMTDCISMTIMRELNVTEILTHDRHFAQEGFITLL